MFEPEDVAGRRWADQNQSFHCLEGAVPVPGAAQTAGEICEVIGWGGAHDTSESAQFRAGELVGGAGAEQVECRVGGALTPAPAAGAGAFPREDGNVVEDRRAAEGVPGLQRAVAQRGART